MPPSISLARKTERAEHVVRHTRRTGVRAGTMQRRRHVSYRRRYHETLIFVIARNTPNYIGVFLFASFRFNREGETGFSGVSLLEICNMCRLITPAAGVCDISLLVISMKYVIIAVLIVMQNRYNRHNQCPKNTIVSNLAGPRVSMAS